MLSVLKTWFGGKELPRSSRPGRASVRLTLESLEDRSLPSTLTVLNTADSSAPGTLRHAVMQANADSQRGVSDTIAFANSLQGATIKLNTPLVLMGGSGTMTINGHGTAGPTITGAYDAFQVVYGSTVSMNGVFIKGCNPSLASDYGGAVDNAGTLYLHACEFDNNNAVFGGAVRNRGNLTMSNCTCDGNSAYHWGGAIDNMGTAKVYACSFGYNFASYGGAIYNDAGATLYVLSTGNAFVSNHTTVGGGGAIYNAGYATLVNAGFYFNKAATSGGAIANYGTINATGITFYHNQAKYYGGGFYDNPGGSWYLSATWNGDTAGLKGPNYYIGGTGKAG
jgi:hypothetical protein